MKADIQQFIGLLFASRDYAHKAHLNTDSFAQHMALGDFYDEIIDLADSLAESWMGRNLTKVGEIPTINAPKGEPLAVMKRLLDVVKDTRDFVDGDTMLSNIVDEIEQLFTNTIYKLKFLS
jgi:DNA-binding ferritin-like protein